MSLNDVREFKSRRATKNLCRQLRRHKPRRVRYHPQAAIRNIEIAKSRKKCTIGAFGTGIGIHTSERNSMIHAPAISRNTIHV